jgi:broad specificity phosphatase PhoE
MKQLLLVRHGATVATEQRAFPRDEPLDDTAGVNSGLALPASHDAVTSPARRARQTAAAAGLSPRTEPRIAECDFGRWAGRTLAELDREAPGDVAAWMSDPGAAPHGGESLISFSARVTGWLDEEAARQGDAIAVTHGGVIKVCVAHALGAGPQAVWRIDIDPLSVTELRAHDRIWSLHRLNWSAG